MAKRKANNFIVSDDDEDEDFDNSGSDQTAQSDEERKSKSRKKGKAIVKDDNNDDEAEASLPKKKKPKTLKAPKVAPDSPDRDNIVIHSTPEGDKYLDLGKKKRATVRTFKGNTLLDIREFYGPDGDEKPGKKGISLSIEQWQALKHSTAAIDSLFAELKK